MASLALFGSTANVAPIGMRAAPPRVNPVEGIPTCSQVESKAWLRIPYLDWPSASSEQTKLWPSCDFWTSSLRRNHRTMSGLGPSPTAKVRRTTTWRL